MWSNESADDTLMGACLKHVQHGTMLDITPSDDNKVVDLIHVDDVSKVIKDCIEQTCPKGIYNLATGTGIKIGNLKRWFKN